MSRSYKSAKSKYLGGTRRTRRTRRRSRKGGNSVLGTAVVPFSILGLQKLLGDSSSRNKKGSRSKTHKGRLDFSTKKGSKVFHRKGKYVRKGRKPYTKKR